MTGGFDYILDEDGEFDQRMNKDLVEKLEVANYSILEEHLRGLIMEHAQLTHSSRAETILENWQKYVQQFVLVKPKSSDVKALLGHRSRSVDELRVQVQ